MEKQIECPKCGKYTVSYDGQVGRLRCFRIGCSWIGPDGYMYHCPVCHHEELEEDSCLRLGSYCPKCGTRFRFRKWNGECD
jgi:hypothetical protein